eukprot:COSAG04_NODE_20561_length_391_cov_0.702055_1_plen_92_part_10
MRKFVTAPLLRPLIEMPAGSMDSEGRGVGAAAVDAPAVVTSPTPRVARLNMLATVAFASSMFSLAQACSSACVIRHARARAPILTPEAGRTD